MFALFCGLFLCRFVFDRYQVVFGLIVSDDASQCSLAIDVLLNLKISRFLVREISGLIAALLSENPENVPKQRWGKVSARLCLIVSDIKFFMMFCPACCSSFIDMKDFGAFVLDRCFKVRRVFLR